MKLSEAKHYLPFVQAAAEGKVIQYKGELTNGWNDCPLYRECFDSSDAVGLQYRIKPTPKLRPWKPEEVPVGAKLSDDNGFIGYIACSCLPVFPDKGEGWNFVLVSEEPIKVHRIFNTPLKRWYAGDMITYIYHLKFSTDHGKTWLPCGVMEE